MDFKAGPVLTRESFPEEHSTPGNLFLAICHYQWSEWSSLELLNAALGTGLQPWLQGGVHMDWHVRMEKSAYQIDLP